MINTRKKIDHRAQRTGDYAESKNSNRVKFDPFYSEMKQAYFDKYWEEFYCNEGEWIIKTQPLNHAFIMPINEHDIKEQFKKVPQEFLEGLEGVILLGGSKKQLKTAWSDLSCFGAYVWNVIFITPFPKAQLQQRAKRLPAPHIQREYLRAGARYEHRDGWWIRTFTLEALKTFYLRDVLMHELGHHVDKHNRKYSDREKFAEWFTMEYGYKRRKRLWSTMAAACERIQFEVRSTKLETNIKMTKIPNSFSTG